MLLFFQSAETERSSLTQLNNYQKWIQSTRLKEYPPVYIGAFGKAIWFPVDEWFEESKQSIAFFRLLDNFSQVVDINLYFFGNHPRERLGYNEFQKFSYLLLPLFLLGIFNLISKRRLNIIVVALLIPLIQISIIGNQSTQGPFLLIPFILICIYLGLIQVIKYTSSWKTSVQLPILLICLMFYVLVTLEMFGYAKF
jgi:hypothetical protein